MLGTSAYQQTELWNGTSWREAADIPATFTANGGGGTATSAISYGGAPAPNSVKSYEWVGTTVSNKTISTD